MSRFAIVTPNCRQVVNNLQVNRMQNMVSRADWRPSSIVGPRSVQSMIPHSVMTTQPLPTNKPAQLWRPLGFLGQTNDQLMTTIIPKRTTPALSPQQRIEQAKPLEQRFQNSLLTYKNRQSERVYSRIDGRPDSRLDGRSEGLPEKSEAAPLTEELQAKVRALTQRLTESSNLLKERDAMVGRLLERHRETEGKNGSQLIKLQAVNRSLNDKLTQEEKAHAITTAKVQETRKHLQTRISHLEIQLDIQKGSVRSRNLEIDFLKEQINEKIKVMVEKEKVIAEKQRVMAEKQKVIIEKKKSLGEKDKLITQKDRLLTEKDKSLIESYTKINELNTKIAELESKVNECSQTQIQLLRKIKVCQSETEQMKRTSESLNEMILRQLEQCEGHKCSIAVLSSFQRQYEQVCSLMGTDDCVKMIQAISMERKKLKQQQADIHHQKQMFGKIERQAALADRFEAMADWNNQVCVVNMLHALDRIYWQESTADQSLRESL